jgi:hypothetical protein
MLNSVLVFVSKSCNVLLSLSLGAALFIYTLMDLLLVDMLGILS